MVKNPPPSRRRRFTLWVGKMSWSRKWQPTPVFWPGESHGQRRPAGYSPRGCKESDMTGPLSTHTWASRCLDCPGRVWNESVIRQMAWRTNETKLSDPKDI